MRICFTLFGAPICFGFVLERKFDLQNGAASRRGMYLELSSQPGHAFFNAK
jgi:hypothetical protein